MTDHPTETALHLHRATCCEFHGVDCRQGRDCPDRPIDTPESVGSVVYGLKVFCIVLFGAIVAAVLPLALNNWPRVVAAFAGVL
ncbi:MAG: hypothetical protein WC023_06355 [Rhodocyclaceae bacterium]